MSPRPRTRLKNPFKGRWKLSIPRYEDYLRPKVIWRSLVGLILIYFLLVGIGTYSIYKKHVQNKFTGAIEKIFPFPAAFVNHQIIYLSRFRLEVSARKQYAKIHNIPGTEAEIEKLVMTQLSNRVLYAQELKKNNITITDQQVNDNLNAIYSQIGGKTKLAAYLNDSYGSGVTLDVFKTWIYESLVEAAIPQQLLVNVSTRHILIALPDNPTEAQIADGKKKIDDIRTRLTDLSKFAEVAKEYSEDISSRDKGGDLGVTNRGDESPIFSKAFEDTIFSLKVGTLSQPVLSKYGWHLVIVDKKEGTINQSLKTYTANLRQAHPVKLFVGK